MQEQDTITTLLSAWNMANEEERAAAVSRTLADNFSYCDPHQPDIVTGKHAFLHYLSHLRRRMNGVKLQIEGTPEIHHRHAKVAFSMIDKEAVTKGVFIADFTENGRVWRLVGFDE